MLLTFISIAIGGFAVLVITLLLGADHDVSVDHDLSLDHDISHDVEGHHWFNIKVISAFATAFGAGGSIARAFDVSTFWSMVVALLSGLLLAVIADALIALFFRQQASSSFSTQELLGKEGIISLSILKGGIGEVQVRFSGTIVSQPACSEDGNEVRQGRRVTIVAAGPPMTVRPI